ncbi:MAG TPA: uracil-DNA glycosylase [Herpetosiphonaceae bacterium]
MTLDLFGPQSIDELADQVRACQRCGLHQTRKQAVPGEGDPAARIMFIGQGASEADNITGRNYSGPSGAVLDMALERAGLDRSQIYLTNIVKCVPLAPRREDGVLDYRAPKSAEVRACRPWLDTEIALVRPKVIVACGAPAAQALIDPGFRLAEERGIWRTGPFGIPAIATWQPAYLMRMKEWDRPRAVEGWQQLVADVRAAAERSRE